MERIGYDANAIPVKKKDSKAKAIVKYKDEDEDDDMDDGDDMNDGDDRDVGGKGKGGKGGKSGEYPPFKKSKH